VAGAQRLVILSDVPGLFDRDPKKHASARLISQLEHVDRKTLEGVSGAAGSSRGTGGMLSKLKAAIEAGKSKIPTHLVQGDEPQILLKIARGVAVGTKVGPS
jgi:glutamate 5-kinase